MSTKLIRRLINIWPPFLFSGIRTRRIADDWSEVEVELRLHWWNQNSVGTMFGGSLYAMADPFYPLMLQHQLGKGYAVVSHSSQVQFLAPGRGRVCAKFALTPARLAEIRAQADADQKCLPEFWTDLVDAAGAVVARVGTTVYVRRRRERAPASAQ